MDLHVSCFLATEHRARVCLKLLCNGPPLNFSSDKIHQNLRIQCWCSFVTRLCNFLEVAWKILSAWTLNCQLSRGCTRSPQNLEMLAIHFVGVWWECGGSVVGVWWECGGNVVARL